MPEKIRNNIGVILNIITSLIVIGSLIYQMGIQAEKINELEKNQSKYEKEFDECTRTIQSDIKNITSSVFGIETKITIIEEKMKIRK